jgi:hypothetical protein
MLRSRNKILVPEPKTVISATMKFFKFGNEKGTATKKNF